MKITLKADNEDGKESTITLSNEEMENHNYVDVAFGSEFGQTYTVDIEELSLAVEAFNNCRYQRESVRMMEGKKSSPNSHPPRHREGLGGGRAPPEPGRRAHRIHSDARSLPPDER